jgi:hypothetical protein
MRTTYEHWSRVMTSDRSALVAEAVAVLAAVDGSDVEYAHLVADQILEDFAPVEIATAVEDLVARCGGRFWYA